MEKMDTSVDTSLDTIVTESPRKTKKEKSKKKKAQKTKDKDSSGRGNANLDPTQKFKLLDFIEEKKLMPALLDQEKSPFKKGIQYCKNNNKDFRSSFLLLHESLIF